jgi:hypothetical protein
MILILSFLAAICNCIMDGIAHYDKYNTWGFWWSQSGYYNAKYQFAINHPKVPKWFINSFLVMFLDAWHFSKLIMILLFFTMVGYYGSWEIGIAGFIIYQITFITCYGKKT